MPPTVIKFGNYVHSINSEGTLSISFSGPLSSDLQEVAATLSSGDAFIFDVFDENNNTTPLATFTQADFIFDSMAGTYSLDTDLVRSNQPVTVNYFITYTVESATEAVNGYIYESPQNGGGISEDVIPPVDIIVPPPTSTATISGLTFSPQPINTYYNIPFGSEASFERQSPITINSDIGLHMAVYDETTQTPVDVPLSFSGQLGYYGNILSTSAGSGNNVQEILVGYSGTTYNTGLTYTLIVPTGLTVDIPTISPGVTAGSYIVNVSDGFYTDYNYPQGISLSVDGGNLVYVYPGLDNTVVSGLTFVLEGVAGGTIVDLGYQSVSALTTGTSFATFEYFMSSTSVTVPEENPPVTSNTEMLSLNHLFTTTAGQTYTFNILGSTPGNIVPDESISLYVPVETMQTLLTYNTEWEAPPGTGGSQGFQPLPIVGLLLEDVVGSWLDALTRGLTGATTGTTYYYDPTTSTVRGDASTSASSLPNLFQSIPKFTYTSNGSTTDYLSTIPEEAITSFTSTSVNTTPLSQVVGDLIVIPSEGQTGAYPGLSGAVQSLFEQAVAFGMVTTGRNTDLASLTLPSLGGVTLGGIMGLTAGSIEEVYGVQFLSGQSLAIYVQYQLEKRRVYNLTALADLNDGSRGASQAIEVTFGGVTFSVPSSKVEVSQPTPVIYQITLIAQ